MSASWLGVLLGKRRQHLLGRVHVHHAQPGGRPNLGRRGDQNDVRATIAGRFRDGVAHLARRVIADVPNGVDGLTSPPGGDQHASTSQIARRAKRGAHDVEDGFGCRQAAETHQTTGEMACFGLDHDHPAALSVSTLATVAGWENMPASMAGATMIGHLAASAVTETGSSARPWASLASIFAVAGATTMTSLCCPSVT